MIRIADVTWALFLTGRRRLSLHRFSPTVVQTDMIIGRRQAGSTYRLALTPISRDWNSARLFATSSNECRVRKVIAHSPQGDQRIPSYSRHAISTTDGKARLVKLLPIIW